METKPKFNFKYLLGISLVSAMGGLLFGYDLVVIGGAKEFYELTFNLSTPAIKGWAVSSCIVGCVIGAMGVGKPSGFEYSGNFLDICRDMCIGSDLYQILYSRDKG